MIKDYTDKIRNYEPDKMIKVRGFCMKKYYY